MTSGPRGELPPPDEADADSPTIRARAPSPADPAEPTLRAAAAPPGAATAPRFFPGFQLAPGMRFGPCETVRPLGRGGMGEVWLAKNVIQGREEALKVLLAADADARERERFVREAKSVMAAAGAPEIVKTYDIAEERGQLYIRMEYVRGVSLDKLERPAPAALLPLFKKMAAALAAGHRHGIVHRDVKPANFMLADDGVLKIMDFGLARAAGDATLTTQDSMGSPPYMSPEQWQRAREVDARADVFSLGVSFYSLLTGRHPFEVPRDAPPLTYYLKLREEDPLPIPPDPGTPRELPNLILKAIAKRPRERFADAGEVLEALELIERDPTIRIAAPVSEASRRRRRLLRGGLGLVALVAAGAIAASFLLAYAARRSTAEIDAALKASRAALDRAEQEGARDAFPEAIVSVDAALARLAEADAARTRALERGARREDVTRLEELAGAERDCAAELRRGLEALAKGKAADAVAAFESAADERADPAAFPALRARAATAVTSAARGEEAERTAEKDVLRALELAQEAQSGALDRAGAAARVERLRAAAARELDERRAKAEGRIASGAGGQAEVERALADFDRYPGGKAVREALEAQIARERRRSASEESPEKSPEQPPKRPRW